MLHHGTDGQYLKSKGHAANPEWGTISAGGDTVAPATNTDNYLPQWNGANSKTLKDGINPATLLTTSAGLKVDQTTPQSIVNGKPTFSDGIILGTTPTVGSFVAGKMYYDALYKTVSVNIDGDVTLQLGQEEHILCQNDTVSTISNGKAVYFFGASNGLPSIKLAKADSLTTSTVFGVSTQNVISGETGLITRRGEIHDIDTTGTLYGETWNAGDILYLSTSTAGALTNIVPTISSIESRVGRVLSVHATTGEIYIDVFRTQRLTDLADVTISTATLDQVLRYNGTEWVNGASVSSSSSTGIEFFNATPEIIATGTNNTNPVSTLSKVPVTTAEQTNVLSLSTNTLLGRAYLYNTALGRTILNGGVWDFTTYAGVNTVTGGRVTTITRNMYQVVPGVGTLTTSGTITSRTATASTGDPFLSGDGTASLITCAYIQTPQGLYPITVGAVGGDSKIATISTPTGYANETTISAGNWLLWKLVVTSTTPAITAISPNYGVYNTTVAYGDITIGLTDKLGTITFGTSNNSTTLTTTYNGTQRNSHVSTPLITLHNYLAGLQGGTTDEFYHMTSAQATVLGNTSGTNTGDANGHTGLIAKADYNAHSILAATTDDTPAVLTVGEQTVVGRTTGGNIAALAIDSDLSSVSANDDTIPSAKATKAMGDAKALLAGSTSQAFQVSQLEVGHATDTTITRTGAGAIALEGVAIPTISSTSTLTAKRINPRLVTVASYTTDTGTSLDVATCDQFEVTAQAGALKLNNPSGTPTGGQKLIVRIKDDGTARALTYDTQFRAMGNALPSTTVLSKTLYLGFIFNATDTKWDLVAVAQEA